MIVADSAADFVDVGPDAVAKIGHLVNEADLGRQHAVGDVLGHFRTFEPHHQKRVFGPQIRLIKFAERLRDFGPSDADDHAIGLGEVVDRRPLLEEFGVRGDVDWSCRKALASGRRLADWFPLGPCF